MNYTRGVKKIRNLKKLLLVSVLFSFLGMNLHGQNVYQIEGKSISELRISGEGNPVISPLVRSSSSLSLNILALKAVNSEVQKPYAAPKVYNYQDLGIFCKLDVQLEKTLKIPVIFRLGEAQQVARKEGK